MSAFVARLPVVTSHSACEILSAESNAARQAAPPRICKAVLLLSSIHPDEEFVVIFDDLNRFARDRDFHFKLGEAFRDRNAKLECLNYRFDDAPDGEFMETIFAAQGQLERKQNARQTSQKTEARMKSGYWVHDCPIGYF